MKPKSPAQLRVAHPFIGTWLSIGSPVIAELASECAFDWLLFDLEHGCGTEATLLSNLQAIKGSGATSIVRVGHPHPDLVQRALDWGADGIMVPHVRTAAEAEACVQAAHYPPRGRRGMSRSVRAYRYGMTGAANTTAIPEPLVMVQIESVAAVEQAAEIAAVDGVDVLFVGPGDLNFDLTVRNGSVKDLDYAGCLQRVLAAAAAHGKRCGILVRDISDLAGLLEKGFSHIAVDSDLTILRRGYQELRSAIDSHTQPKATA